VRCVQGVSRKRHICSVTTVTVSGVAGSATIDLADCLMFPFISVNAHVRYAKSSTCNRLVLTIVRCFQMLPCRQTGLFFLVAVFEWLSIWLCVFDNRSSTLDVLVRSVSAPGGGMALSRRIIERFGLLSRGHPHLFRPGLLS
jgi:hypothetical protein